MREKPTGSGERPRSSPASRILLVAAGLLLLAGILTLVFFGRYFFRGWNRYDDPFFSEGLAPVTFLDGKVGYIDKKGKTVIPARYAEGYAFSGNGLALVGEDVEEDGETVRRYAWIDKKGNAVKTGILPAWDRFDGGVTVCFDGGAAGLADADGTFLSDVRFEEFSPYGKSALFDEEGLLAVKIGGGWGFLGRDGTLAVDAAYLSLTSFDKEGFSLASFEKDGEETFVFLNAKGERVFSEYEAATPFSASVAAVKENGTWQYLTAKGKTLTVAGGYAPFGEASALNADSGVGTVRAGTAETGYRFALADRRGKIVAGADGKWNAEASAADAFGRITVRGRDGEGNAVYALLSRDGKEMKEVFLSFAPPSRVEGTDIFSVTDEAGNVTVRLFLPSGKEYAIGTTWGADNLYTFYGKGAYTSAATLFGTSIPKKGAFGYYILRHNYDHFLFAAAERGAFTVSSSAGAVGFTDHTFSAFQRISEDGYLVVESYTANGTALWLYDAVTGECLGMIDEKAKE